MLLKSCWCLKDSQPARRYSAISRSPTDPFSAMQEWATDANNLHKPQAPCYNCTSAHQSIA
ncbi:hypothetical protein RR46_08435 [Papilio xuthus]|uniref:Uncharacterized protein n=1 Tax=Papilio xuthus TaxID=66420 RepID=A0A194PH23_PAPXU|nr:hypothetical protein RR46_08435 [Papilio xuthus]